MCCLLKLTTTSALLCLILASASQAQLANAKIVFSSTRDGNYEIYVMNFDGTNLTRLTNNTASDEHPSWSPDGKKITFASNRDGNYEIYVMNVDGTNQTRLTNNTASGQAGWDHEPSWSPDGTKIAFWSGRDDGNYEIYVMNDDGTNQVNLTNRAGVDYSPSWSPDGTKIAFMSTRDGNAEIYVMNGNGTNQTRLTNNAAWDYTPSWSPDATKIAFYSDRDGNSEIYIMNADGINQTRLTNNTAIDSDPSWSPDGTKIAFHSDRDGNNEIYLMNADGTNQIRLTNNSVSDVWPSWSLFLPPLAQVSLTNVNAGIVNKGFSGTATFTVTNSGGGTLSVSNITSSNPQFTVSPPSFSLTAGLSRTVTVTFSPTVVGWEQSTLTISHNGTNGPTATVTANGIGRVNSPTGSLASTKTAFTSQRDGNDEIYVMNSDGTNPLNLTKHASHDYRPSWSPDGKKIVFLSYRDGNYEIYIMNADGTNQTRLTNNAVEERWPSWSPDGTKIAFESYRDGNYEIYIMNADGTNQTRLTNNVTDDSQPSWSPDGMKIAFTSSRNGDYEIYVMNADGTNPINLTNHTANDFGPSWSPDGMKIAFYSVRDGNPEIYVMNADGTNPINLTNHPALDTSPSWSPDGTKLSIWSGRDGNWEIYVMNADGTNPVNLTNHASDDRLPSWSPFLPPSAFISAPTINSINPTSMAQGSANQNVTILGTNFQSGATVSFSGTGITVNSVTFNSLTQLTVNISIALTAASGARNVTVTNPDTGTVTANGVFTVTQIASATNSTITASPASVVADGVAESTITITLRDANNSLISGKSVSISATGTSNTITQPASATDANGQTTAKIKSTKAEVKTISAIVTTDNINLTNTVTVTFTPGPVSASASTVSVLPISVSTDSTTGTTVTITLLDANSNPVSGKNVIISATGTGNTITQPASPTDVNGRTTAVIKSTKAETKTISAINITDNITLTNTATVTFTAGTVSAITSTITASPTSAIADGTANITLTVTLKDANGNTVSGKNVTISATGTGNTITQPASPTDSNGQATATIKSTKAEVKTISATDTTDNLNLTNTATVTFTPGAVSASASTITASPTSAAADNTATITVTVTLKDANGNLVSGKNVTVSATGTGNTITQPAGATDTNGQTTATIKSTKAEAKTASATDVTDNITLTNTVVVTFTPGPVSASKSTITVSPNSISVDNVIGATMTVTLLDANDNPVSGKNVAILATGTGNTITQPSSPTNASGQTTATIKSTKAESKTISATDTTDNISLLNTTTVTFTPGVVSTTTSTLSASPTSAIADGNSAITVTVALLDANNNPISGKSVTISAAGTGNTITQSITPTNASGQITATIKATKAETKTISATDITDNIVFTNTTAVTFTPGPVSSSKSTIVVSPSSISVDNTTGVALTVTLLDANDNPVSGKNVSLSVTGTGNTVTQPIPTTNVNGQTTATIKSIKAETKTITATVDSVNLSAQVTFVPGQVSSANSAITPSALTLSVDDPNGITFTLTLMDQFKNLITGRSVTVNAITVTPNAGVVLPTLPLILAPSADGKVSFAIKSTKAEAKTVSITVDNVALVSTTLTFEAGAPSASKSTVSVITPVSVDSSAGSTVTVTLKDQYENLISNRNVNVNVTVNPAVGITVTPSSSFTISPNANGQFTFAVKSTKAEAKTVSVTVDNVALTSAASIIFEVGAPSAFKSTVSAITPVSVDNASGSTVTVILKDQYENLIANKNQTVNVTVTPNTGVSITPIAPFNITTDANGLFTFAVKSTKAEEKTITVTIGTIELTQKPVIKFDPGAVSASKSTVSAISPISVDNPSGSTVTVVLKDQYENLISNKSFNVNVTVNPSVGITIVPLPPFTINTDANGQFIFAVKSNKSGIKTLKVTVNTIDLAQQPNIKFEPGASSKLKSSITTTSSAVVDNVTGSTITVSLKDQYENSIANKSIKVNATVIPTGGIATIPATSPFDITTDENGQFSYTVKSTKAESKTVSIITDNVELNPTTIIFLPSLPEIITVTSDKPELFVGQVTKIKTTVEDKYKNLIKDAVVSISTTLDSGISEAVAPVINNNDGSYAAEYKPKTTGKVVIKAVVSNKSGSVELNVPNRPPTLGFEPVEPYLIDEGKSLSITVKSEDPDGDKVIISSSALTNSTFELTTGKFVFTPNHFQSGPQKVSFIADDGKLNGKTTKEITIQVNGRPEFTLIGNQLPNPSLPIKFSVDENQQLTILVAAKDLNNDPIAYSAEPLPQGAIMEAQTLKWRPSFDTVKRSEGSKKFLIKLKISDGKLDAFQDIEVTVRHVSSTESVSIISVSDKLVADGKSTLNLEIIPKDANGRLVDDEEITLKLEPALGSLLSSIITFDVLGKKYLATYTSSTKTGKVAIIATSSNGKTDRKELELISGPISSEKTQQSSQIPATAQTDLFSPAKIVILLRDANDNPIVAKSVRLIVSGGDDNLLNPSSGEKLTDIDGKAEFTLASEKVGKREITVIGDGVPLFTATIDFVPTGVPSSSMSTASLDRTEQMVGDQAVNEVTVKIKVVDKNGNPLSGKQVEITTIPRHEKIMISSATDTDAQGETSVKIKSTKAMEVAINVTIQPDKIILDSKPKVTFKPREPEKMDLKVSPTKLLADGKSEADITVTVFDAFDNPIKDAKVELSADLGKVSVVSSKGDGSYVARYTSGTKAGADTIRVIVGNKSQAVQIELSAVTQPDFVLTSPLTNQTVKAGETVTFSLGIQPIAGFNLPVTLLTDGLPPTVKAEFSPKEVKPIDVTTFSQLTLTVSSDTPKGEYKFRALGTAEGKLREISLVLQVSEKPKIPVPITIRIEPKEPRLWDKVKIIGNLIFPPADVPLRQKVAIDLIYTSPKKAQEQQKVNANEKGEYDSEFQPKEVGEWTLKARWDGDDKYASADQSISFRVRKGEVLAVFEPPIPQNKNLGEKLQIIGQLRIKAGVVDKSLSDQKITIQIVKPDNVAILGSGITNERGFFAHEIELNRDGIWKISASWDGNESYEKSVFTESEVIVGTPSPKVIVVLGGGNENENPAWNKFSGLTNYVYKILKNRKLTDDDIYYLSPTLKRTQVVDEITSESALEFAITQWAKERVGPHVPLFIYLLSHNLDDKFILEKRGATEKYLTPDKLNEWLDTLKQDTPVTIIIEACFSGNFIAKKAAGKPILSKPGRVVIASASQDRQALIEGASLLSFTRLFFNKISKNKDIRSAFLESREGLRTSRSLQSPQMDADGDGKGNDPIRDFPLVEKRFIPLDVEFLPSVPEIKEISKPQQLKMGETKAIISMKVTGVNITRVSGTIIPPDYNPDRTFNSWTDVDFATIEFQQKTEGVYEASPDKFTQPGIYTIVVYAENPDGSATPVETTVEVPAVLSIIKLSPDTVEQGEQNKDIIIIGEKFDGKEGEEFGGTINFLPSPKIAINSVKYLSSTQLKVNISVASDALIGSRTVIVINPDGESTKKDGGLKIEPSKLPDIDGDGEVSILDMVIVAISFGQKIPSPPPAQNPDVNGDGEVNIFDLVLIGRRFGEKMALKAAPTRLRDLKRQKNISDALSDVDVLMRVRDLLKSVPAPNSGILRAIAELERLIAIANPGVKETKLLPNYPNPFNPETWMPYQLAESADVVIRIYNVAGGIVQTLRLGRKEPGFYISKDRAAYWDGRNKAGEMVASGVYLYRLQAGNFSAMRRMLLVK